MEIKWDGHTHTPFCKHGSSTPLELYAERAVELGFTRYSLTEHPPLPHSWINDPSLMKQLAMDWSELPLYLDNAWELKRRYSDQIEITVGLELDYLFGKTDFTSELVSACGQKLEDAIVSVHYLPGVGGIRSIDYTPDDFKEGLLTHYGSMERIIDTYYDHVELAIEYAMTLPMRTRIGHLNLIEKFRQVLPDMDDSQLMERLRRIIDKLANSDVGLDVNMAGLRIGTCGKPYVPPWFLQECRKRNIVCVYGSDAHKLEDVGFAWDLFEQGKWEEAI
jgi:histidinol-phosphatase (PHP family)